MPSKQNEMFTATGFRNWKTVLKVTNHGSLLNEVREKIQPVMDAFLLNGHLKSQHHHTETLLK